MQASMSTCLIKLTQVAPMLNPSEKKVADYILANSSDIIGLAISELAARANASPAAVIRLCKKINFSGYREFTIALSREYQADTDTREQIDFVPFGSMEEVAGHVFFQNRTAIDNTSQIIDPETLVRAAEALDQAARIDFLGVGASLIVAMDAQQKFLRIGKQCNCSQDFHLQILNTLSLKKGDVSVFISYSGMTPEIIQALEVAGQTEATSISITQYGDNPVARLAKINLFVSAFEPSMRIGAMGSRVAQLTMIDMLYSYVISSRYEHYSGILGHTKKTVQAIKTNNDIVRK